MSHKKLSADFLQQGFERLRKESRSRARRLRHAGALVVCLCLLLFLALWLFAAKTLWDGLQAPVHVAILIGVLAAASQRVLGLVIRGGQIRRRVPFQPLWWTVTLLSSAALVTLAG